MFKRTTRPNLPAPGGYLSAGRYDGALERAVEDYRRADLLDPTATMTFLLAVEGISNPSVPSAPATPEVPSRRMWWGTQESDHPTRDHTHCARGHELPPAHWHYPERKDCGCPVELSRPCGCDKVELISDGGRRYVELCGCGSKACTDRRGRWSLDREARTDELSELRARLRRAYESQAMPPAITLDSTPMVL